MASVDPGFRDASIVSVQANGQCGQCLGRGSRVLVAHEGGGRTWHLATWDAARKQWLRHACGERLDVVVDMAQHAPLKEPSSRA